MTAYRDRFWQSTDGLQLHYRDYAGPEAEITDAGRPPILCLPGLTRNARDFAGLAQRLAGEWRVLCPDMRGRGGSDYAPNGATYNPRQYVADIDALCRQAGIARFVAVGTSLGGLLTMLLAMADRGRIAGALINDIGPALDGAGLARIGKYVGNKVAFADWAAAAQALAETQLVAYPDYRPADWLAMAQRVMRQGDDDVIALDYDMRIAEAFGQTGAPPLPDLWAGIDALADCPVLLVRGELSDLLSGETFARMRQRLPYAEAITLPRIGHAPTLDEPAATAAIDRWLAQVA